MRIKAIDLCAGAGGWACAARGLPIDVVLAVDLWDRALRTYKLNHPHVEAICGDVRDAELQATVLAKAKEAGASLLLGGIPCEWLSVYRNVSPVALSELADERKTLDAVLGLVRAIEPRWWCLEDVTALIRELPLFTPYHVIDSRGYSAQRRKRVYVGQFPRPAVGRDAQTVEAALRPGPYRIGARSADRAAVRRMDKGDRRKSQTYAVELDRKGPTVTTSGASRRDAEMVLLDPSLPGGRRQLEWQELAALQGFPPDYVFYGSPGDVATMIGRAIQIDTGRAILRAIVAQAQTPADTEARSA